MVLSGLSARGQRLGVMLLVHSTSGRRYGAEDVELVRHLAERIALALDNARLYEAEQASRRAAERSAAAPRRCGALPRRSTGRRRRARWRA